MYIFIVMKSIQNTIQYSEWHLVAVPVYRAVLKKCNAHAFIHEEPDKDLTVQKQPIQDEGEIV